jgi:hypothetical protein
VIDGKCPHAWLQSVEREVIAVLMSQPRRFPLPWTVEQLNDSCASSRVVQTAGDGPLRLIAWVRQAESGSASCGLVIGGSAKALLWIVAFAPIQNHRTMAGGLPGSNFRDNFIPSPTEFRAVALRGKPVQQNSKSGK